MSDQQEAHGTTIEHPGGLWSKCIICAEPAVEGARVLRVATETIRIRLDGFAFAERQGAPDEWWAHVRCVLSVLGCSARLAEVRAGHGGCE